jgi:hypothetical protein
MCEPAQNPFSTRRVRPGAIRFHFPAGKSAGGLVERLRKNHWQGQIVGPHGSGKSALVSSLIAAIGQTGRGTFLIELHDGQRRLPASLRRAFAIEPGTVVICDGYEQLGLWGRFTLRRLCHRRRLGLVVTSHRSVGMPDVFRTTTSLALAQRIVHDLLESEPPAVTTDDVAQRFVFHQGNMREILFDLYDLYEERRGRRQC